MQEGVSRYNRPCLMLGAVRCLPAVVGLDLRHMWQLTRSALVQANCSQERSQRIGNEPVVQALR